MRFVATAAAAALLALSACATVPASAPGDAGAPEVAAPSEPLDLGGDWRRSSVASVAGRFEETVRARYAENMQIATAWQDLRANGFDCREPDGGGEERPAQACRKSQEANRCTHIWEVQLFEGDAGRVGRTRSLYDRRCGGEGLLGGPD